eukprot:m.18321 g.18321  ORF g.18321 m.18321 type:complete len:1119 (-) comp5301_c0_seq1:24-3380(-)
MTAGVMINKNECTPSQASKRAESQPLRQITLTAARLLCLAVFAGLGGPGPVSASGATRNASVSPTPHLRPASPTAELDAVQQCLSHVECHVCLTTLSQGIRNASSPQLSIIFYNNLKSTSACAPHETPPALLLPAFHLMRSFRYNILGSIVTACMVNEYACFIDELCRQCLSAVYSTPLTPRIQLTSAACRVAINSSSLSVLTELAASSCAMFPKCNFAKDQCENTPHCQSCLTTLKTAGSVAATTQCPNGTAAVQLDLVVEGCTAYTSMVCSYWKNRCYQNGLCEACLAAMDGGSSKESIVQGSLSQACASMFQNRRATFLLQQIFFDCPSQVLNPCLGTIGGCVLYDPLCASCLDHTAAPTDATACELALSANGFGVDAACLPCDSSVDLINRLVLATSIVGALSMVMCTVLIVVIIARSKDLVSLRDRVIIGLLFANLVYSSANAVPVGQLNTSIVKCGQLTASFEVIRFNRAMWFFGKFTLVSFEIFIVAASIWALAQGQTVILRTEILAHLTCITTGAVAFCIFYIRCAQINRDGYNAQTQSEAGSDAYAHLGQDDTVDDDFPAEAASNRFEHARAEFNSLMQRMLQAWLACSGVAVILWAILRIYFIRMVSEWQKQAVVLKHRQATDEWANTRRSTWAEAFTLMEMQKKAYAAVARPLEPFVLLFLIFAIPATVMALDWCQDRSQASAEGSSMATTNDEITYGSCDAWSELILAFRSVGTVVVYLWPRERRTELGDMRTNWRLLVCRLSSCCSSPDVQPQITTSYLPEPNSCRWIEAHEIDFDKMIAEGSFGVVWEGNWGGGLPVAIKVFKSGGVDADGDPLDPLAESDFRQECAMLGKLSHPHVLKLLGYGTTTGGQFFIVSELMTNGSLRKVLTSDLPLAWPRRYSIALQLALGMEHLHSIPIVHRDLKSPNVLLDEGLRVKVADFGSSKNFRAHSPKIMRSAFTGASWTAPRPESAILLSSSASTSTYDVSVGLEELDWSMTKGCGTVLWNAPEVFRGDRLYGPKADVYSFGLIMWECCTRSRPWDELGPYATWLEQYQSLASALQKGQRPTIPLHVRHSHPIFVSILERCWRCDPAERPDFSAVVHVLKQYRCTPSPGNSNLTEPLLG